MAELKSCPFCGGVDIRCSFKVTGRFLKQYHVAMFCNDCHTYGPRILTIKKEHDDYRGRDAVTKDEKYEAEAIEAWNKRAESEELKFTRDFIREHGLDFALASAWNRGAEDENKI